MPTPGRYVAIYGAKQLADGSFQSSLKITCIEAGHAFDRTTLFGSTFGSAEEARDYARQQTELQDVFKLIPEKASF